MAILEKETYEKFGYYSGDLKPKSGKRIVVKCDKCGKIREIIKSQYHSLCKSCAHGEGGKVKRICKQCEKEFETYPSLIKRGGGKFCSTKCSYKYRTGKNNPLWNKVKKICKQCDKQFEIHPYLIKNGRGIFCSRSCARKARRFPNHHTKPELIFEEICKKNNLPFKYTGDGSFWVGKKPAINPDFIECNGKRIVVEIFGDYWHSPLLNRNMKEHGTLEYRERYYKRHKWISIFFWESDLLRKDAEQFVLLKLSKYALLPSFQ